MTQTIEGLVAEAQAERLSADQLRPLVSSPLLLAACQDGSDSLSLLASAKSFGALYLLILHARWHALQPKRSEQEMDTDDPDSPSSPTLSSGMIPEHTYSKLPTQAGWESLVPATAAYCASFDVKDTLQFLDLLHELASSIEALCYHDPTVSFSLLAPLLNRFTNHPESSVYALTPIHRSLLYAAFLSKNYDISATLLKTDVSELDMRFPNISIHDYLNYHYYAGLILIETQNYDRSFKFLNMVLTVPGNAISVLSLKAFKKMVLLQLIRNGEEFSPSKLVSMPLTNALRNIHADYTDFASAYVSGQKELTNKISQNNEIFIKDNNEPLVKIAMQRIQAHKIKKLTKIYSKLTLCLVADRLGLDPKDASNLKTVRNKINSLVATGELKATISRNEGSAYENEHDATVSFEEPYESFDCATGKEMIESAIKDISNTRSQMDRQSWALLSHEAFVKKIMNSSHSGEFVHAMADVGDESMLKEDDDDD